MHIEKLNNLSIPTIILGGNMKESTFVTYGEQTLNEINDLNFDIAFIGANGISQETYSTADLNEALIKRAAIKKATNACLLYTSPSPRD